MNGISGTPYPTGVKSKRNQRKVLPPGVRSKPILRQGLPHRVKVSPNSGHKNPSWVKSQPNSGARFTPQGESVPQSGAAFTPPGYDDLNARIFIAHPAEIQTESSLPHCIPGKNANRISGRILPPWQKSKPKPGQGFAYLAE